MRNCGDARVKSSRCGWIARIVFSIVVGVAGTPGGKAEEPKPDAQTHSMSAVTALLDKEQPDPAKIGRLRADADAAVSPGQPLDQLFAAYERRAIARRHLGRTHEAIADLEQAVAIGKGKVTAQAFARVRIGLVARYRGIEFSGDPKSRLICSATRTKLSAS